VIDPILFVKYIGLGASKEKCIGVGKMWVCHKHIKEALTVFEIPHIHKARYEVKCSLCNNRAIANLYYAHKPSQLKNKRRLYFQVKTEQKQTS
jgi:hypothetical protein